MNTRCRIVSELRGVVPPGATVLLDIWGVVHDGMTPYPGALDALAHMVAADVELLGLTNTSYRENRVRDDLCAMGVAQGWIHTILSAGEQTRKAVAHLRERGELRPDYVRLGDDENAQLLAGLDVVERTVEHASFVLVTDGELDVTSRQILARCLERKLPLVCANPDLGFVDQTHVSHEQAGSIAAAYRKGGGQVLMFGKPDPQFYTLALTRRLNAGPVFCIGDTIATDLLGAAAAGLDAIWVCRNEDERSHVTAAGVEPIAIIDTLRW